MSETLLIVDDSPTNIEVLYKTLESPNYRILVARDGETALSIVASQQPTLVLLDIMMPGMDGFEVCQAIKSNPLTSRTSVIFLSALGDTDAKVKGFQLGGVDYISKPFQAEEVVARVSNHVRIHQLERDLEHRNQTLASDMERILSTMQEGVYGLDVDGRVVFSNAAATALTGYEAYELLGQTILDTHFHGDDGQQVDIANALARLQANQRIHYDKVKMQDKSGQAFYADIAITPNFSDGVFQGAVAVFRNITDRVLAEEALVDAQQELTQHRQKMAHVERLSTMGEMAAGLAHEVNQPLTAITNYASVAIRLLSQKELNIERTEETLNKLQTQAVRASDVVQRLRDFAKTPKNNKVVKNVNVLLASVYDLAEVDSRKLGINIDVQHADSPVAVYVDDVQIQQVALNLVRNAMEATAMAKRDDKPVELGMMVQDDAVRFTVRDFGVGLAEDAEEHLFHPFYTTKTNGMGIGLSICAGIMQDHGGDICYERLDEGTLFTMTLPVYD